MNSDLISLQEIAWLPFGGQTKGVFRKSLSSAAFPSGFKGALILAEAGGEFPEHVDPYAHIFYILEGEGEFIVEKEKMNLKKESVLTVAAGKRHGYRNPGPGDLKLITLNIF